MSVALYRHYAADGTLLYVGVSSNPARRLAQHIKSGRTDIDHMLMEWFADRPSALAAERAAIAAERPRLNKIVYCSKEARRRRNADPNAVSELIATLGPALICATFRVTKHSLRQAQNFGKFPASWYLGMTRLCEAHGVECPQALFAWRGDNPQALA
jgi:predicted GIY-YIG superfamily endonuclease